MLTELDLMNALVDKVNVLIKNQIPIGTMMYSATVPDGFLICNGSELSRTDYSELFKAIGTTFGSGDGSSTFKLPDVRDRFLEGSGTNSIGSYISAGLPNIVGNAYLTTTELGYDTVHYADGAFRTQTEYSTGYGNARDFSTVSTGDSHFSSPLFMDASRSSAIYGSSSTVQPNALSVYCIIKYKEIQ